MAKNEKARLAIDFPNRGNLLEFIEKMRATGIIPPDAVSFVMDSIDQEQGGGITFSNTFILKRKGDRGEGFELQEVESTRTTKYTH